MGAGQAAAGGAVMMVAPLPASRKIFSCEVSKWFAAKCCPVSFRAIVTFAARVHFLGCKEDAMQTETRKLRDDLAPEERERAERIGRLEYKSHRRPDMRVERFIPSKEQH
jgi:hypothetical protein